MTDQLGNGERGSESGPVKAEGEDGASTVGTGSVIGLGCVLLVVLVVVAAIAYRLLGGSW